MNKDKKWVVTYPGLGDHISLKLHAEDCRYLRPSKNKPDTGKKLATQKQLDTYEECKVC